MFNPWGQPPKSDPVQVERIKSWVREMLGLDETLALTVVQLNCAEDDCPDVETVVGVLEPGRPRKFKVFKPLAEVTRDDLEASLRGPA